MALYVGAPLITVAFELGSVASCHGTSLKKYLPVDGGVWRIVTEPFLMRHQTLITSLEFITYGSVNEVLFKNRINREGQTNAASWLG